MRNFKILILIAVILTLIMVLIVRERQHTETIFTYLEREVQQEEARLKVSQELIKNYNELQANYDELLENSDIEWQDFICTGYSDYDGEQGTNGITATGFKTNCGLPIVAVDPEVIEPFSIIEIKGLGGFVALDIGDFIKGNKIDILFDSKEEALKFGKQELFVRIIR